MFSDHRRAMLLAGACGASLSCSTDTPVEPTTPPAVAGPSFEIEDGAHGGNAGFFFLPPLVPAPAYSGAANPNILGSLAVEVCDLGTSRPPTNTSCGSTPVVVARFTSTTGTASETLRYDAGAGQYIVNWHTDKSDGGTLATTHYYRLRVLAAKTVLGQADIDPVRSASDLKNYDTGTSIPLVNGRTLPSSSGWKPARCSRSGPAAVSPRQPMARPPSRSRPPPCPRPPASPSHLLQSHPRNWPAPACWARRPSTSALPARSSRCPPR